MTRIAAALALVIAFCDCADAQVIIRTGRPRTRVAVVPMGVIQPPMLPVAGSPLQHNIFAPRHQVLRGPNVVNPYYFGGYAPIWPVWYDMPPPAPTIVNNYIPAPAAPEVALPPAPPPELRARLTLNVPSGAKVWLAGIEMDSAIAPLILESPVLEEGQTYTFDVKVTWIEGRDTEERARKVTVDAGASKSLTYVAVR
jgi:uncharacterized protein (TIGR03000 family)